MRDLPNVAFDGAYHDGRLEVQMLPVEVLERLSAIGPPTWFDGGPLFGSHHAVWTSGSRFTLSLRHSRGRLPRIEGKVEPTEGGSVIHYEVLTARIILYVLGPFFVLPLLVVGAICLVLMAMGRPDDAAAWLLGILFTGCLWLPLGLGITALVLFMHRAAARDLHRFFLRRFDDVVVWQAEAVE